MWQGAITLQERQDIERVQKMYIIFGDKYENYTNALKLFGLETLETRRKNICLKFANRADKHKKHTNWFKIKPNTYTRLKSESIVNLWLELTEF